MCKSKYILTLILALLLSIYCNGGPTIQNGPNDLAAFLHEYLAIKYKLHDINEVLYVSIKRQKLYHIKGDQIINEYLISSSKKGIGNSERSFQTPIGLHRIKEKIGNDIPQGGIFDHRQFTGKVYNSENPNSQKDLITSRILWLQGLENGYNSGSGSDSYERCIYIHGTHEEYLIGTPASHGCIRMRNNEVIQLFEKVPIGTYVVILNN